MAGVKTVSTYPPEGTLTKDAETIVRTTASKKVSPKGVGSGIRIIQYFINCAGKNLPAGEADLEGQEAPPPESLRTGAGI